MKVRLKLVATWLASVRLKFRSFSKISKITTGWLYGVLRFHVSLCCTFKARATTRSAALKKLCGL